MSPCGPVAPGTQIGQGVNVEKAPKRGRCGLGREGEGPSGNRVGAGAERVSEAPVGCVNTSHPALLSVRCTVS